jgi:predicted Zn-dependent protease
MRAALFGIVMLTAACAATPHDAATRFVESGDRFATEGRDAAALIEYRNALRERPDWSEAHRKMGDTLGRMGRTRDAYRSYAAAARFVDGRRLPDNEDELVAVVDRNPESVAARLALAEQLIGRGDRAAAETHLAAAVAADPDNELAGRSLAALYLAGGKKGDAERLLTKAAALQPTRYRSEIALADFLMQERRYPEARAVLEQPRTRGTFATDVTLRLAAIDYAEGRTGEAHRALADLIAAHASAEAWTLLADFRFREGKLTDAFEATREALALDSELPAALNLADTIRRKQLGR